MNKRIEWIDICKGIGILAMICGHIGLPHILDKYIHAWHMPIFFILSGYLFKEYNLQTLIIKKSKSLLIPYLTFGSILYILNILKNFIKHDTDLLKQLVDLFTFNTIGDLPFGNSIWFLTCLFCVEIIFAFINKHSKNEYVLSSMVMLVCLIGYLFSFSNIRLVWGLDSALTSIGFYYFGYLIKKYKENKFINKMYSIKLSNIFILLIISTITIFINDYVNLRTIKYGNLILFYFNGIATSIMIIMFSIFVSNKKILNKIVDKVIYIGENSLIFLALNQVIIYIVKNILEILLNNKLLISGCNLILTLLILSIATFIINEKFSFILGKFNNKKLELIID